MLYLTVEKMKFLKNLQRSLPRLGLFEILVAFFVTIIIWASIFQVDKTINAPGVVEPKGKVLAIQNRFDSKIKTVGVVSGKVVSAGEIIFVLDPEQDLEAVEEQKIKVTALGIKLRRLAAQSNLVKTFHKLESDPDDIYAQELEQLKLEVGVFENEIMTLQNELQLLENEKVATNIKIETNKSLVEFLKEKLSVMKKLYEREFEGRLAFLESKQQHGKALGELLVAREDLRKLEAKTELVNSQIKQKRLNFKRDNAANFAEVNQELKFAELQFQTISKRVSEFNVVAPESGTISKVFFNNPGQVVATGSTLAELIPIDRPLIFTARIKPGDISEISKGQVAKITLSNMDVRTTPPLMAKISNVEENSRLEDNGARYFISEIEFTNENKVSLIKPGVDGTANILLGSRTVLEYVLEPIFSSLQGSLSE